VQRLLTLLILTAGAVSGCVPDPGRAERIDGEYLRIVAAEDARPESGPHLQALMDGTGHEVAFIRHASVRALGRLERPTLADEITPLLDDPSPPVRRSATNALAQAYHTAEDGTPAATILLARLEAEPDPAVRGTIARSLGRLTVGPRLRREIAEALADISEVDDGDAPAETLVGVALGLESLVRRHPGEGVSARVAARLHELARLPTTSVYDPWPARIRGLALNALGIARRLDRATLLTALRDEEPQPSATAARYIEAVPAAQRAELFRRVMANEGLHTVLEGLLDLQTAPLDRQRCRYLTAGARPLVMDEVPPIAPVSVLAVDGLDRPCPDLSAQRNLLARVAANLDTEGTPWQAASRALVSLASIAPDRAAELVGVHLVHENDFVRAYAARAATAMRDTGALRSLMDDPSPNVRTVAASGLFAVEGHTADALLVEQLASEDPQLLLTVANLLEGTPEPELAAEAALDAFRRISEAERETWRDPRRALLDLLASVGGPELVPGLEPYLTDYDALVADDVADLVSRWTGRTVEADPRPLAPAELPDVDGLRAMDGALVRLHMEGGGAIDIELDPYLAATNAYRFFRLVDEGYFDGLTFHRWAPNFVLQGGSPGANEYQGAAAYSRDEVGLMSHWRGTVGISTRGRDTGDAQIFINLLDNVRLDHDYTIIGRIVSGIEVVDTAVDGAVIERAEVVEAPEGA